MKNLTFAKYVVLESIYVEIFRSVAEETTIKRGQILKLWAGDID